MRIRCPHCSQPIEMVPDLESADITCPSCGSHFSLLGGETETATAGFGPQPSIRHFLLYETIGIGQFGRVWRAFDERLRRVVAIKVPHEHSLSPVERRHFRREAQTAALLDHPHIVKIYEVGETGETIYIVCQYIDGPSLREWLRSQPSVDLEAAVRLMKEVARAVDFAHSKGIIHRDLKPANVILDSHLQPHVADFGLAKDMGAQATIAITGQVVGTPAYMSPEQIRDAHRVDARSDVYSLGTIFYEMITGHRPFSGSRGILFQQVLLDDPRRPRHYRKDIPLPLEAICLKTLAKDPHKRYQTAGEFADDLERFERGDQVVAVPYSQTRAALHWLKRRPSVVASISLTLVILLFGWSLATRPPVTVPAETGTKIRLETIPPGAKLAIVPIDGLTGELRIDRIRHAAHTPLEMKLPPGDYWVVAYTPDETRFHEVFRRVPAENTRWPSIYRHLQWKRLKNGVCVLPSIKLFSQQDITAQMARARGGSLAVPAFDRRGPSHAMLPPWFVDSTETTYQMAIDSGAGASARVARVMRERGVTPQHALTRVRYHAAIEWAEYMGKRLMTAHEYEYLLQLKSSETSQPDRSSSNSTGSVDDPQWDRVSDPRLQGELVGLRSNAMEWTTTWWTDDKVGMFFRMVVGTSPLIEDQPIRQTPSRDASRDMQALQSFSIDERLGFRCARSVRPRTRPRDFPRVLYPQVQQAARETHRRSGMEAVALRQ